MGGGVAGSDVPGSGVVGGALLVSLSSSLWDARDAARKSCVLSAQSAREDCRHAADALDSAFAVPWASSRAFWTSRRASWIAIQLSKASVIED